MKLRNRIIQYTYPILIVVVILMIIFFFFYLATHISQFIDTALEEEQKTQTQELAIETQTYQAATKEIQQETSTTTTSTAENATSSVTIIEEKAPENKALITIAVLNSTLKSGKAAELSDLLATQGYKVTFVGNEKKQEPKTLIKAKDTAKKIFPNSIKEISDIVRSIYNVSDESLAETSEYDIVIVIGMN